MKKTSYLKDTESFWKERNFARRGLDKKRAGAPLEEKARIAETLRKDAILLKSSRIPLL